MIDSIPFISFGFDTRAIKKIEKEGRQKGRMKTETTKSALADEWVAPVKPIRVDFTPRNHLVTSRFSLRQTWSSLVQAKNKAPDFGVETANCRTPLFFLLHSSFCIGCRSSLFHPVRGGVPKPHASRGASQQFVFICVHSWFTVSSTQKDYQTNPFSKNRFACKQS